MTTPLRFRPIYKSVLWGGRRLESRLGRRLPPAEPIGESWELVDFDDAATGRTWSSVIDNGRFAGRTLREAVRESPELIYGPGRPAAPYPLLVKFIDARQNLSVQVHPDEDAARRLGRGARPKTECWFILDAEPGAAIYRGVKPGVGADELRRAALDGTMEPLLIREPVAPGEMYFVPAGTVHAIGAGVMLAEVQQASDTTYRLWDWNRVDPVTGKPRELHLDAALQCLADRPPPPVGRLPEGRTSARLVDCPAFRVQRERHNEGHGHRMGPGPEVWICLGGRARLGIDDGEPLHIRAGDTVMLPGGGLRVLDEVDGLDVLMVN